MLLHVGHCMVAALPHPGVTHLDIFENFINEHEVLK
jgi:hypothetical protein